MILLLLAILLTDRTCISEDYILQVGDRVAISVMGALNFTYKQTISPQGNIFVQSPKSPFYTYSEAASTQVEEISPVIEVTDVVHVAGLSVREASEILEKRFKKYFKNIKVELNVITFTDQVYVNGAVTTPQAYPFLPNRTVQEYIALAGGPLESADLDNVIVERGSQNIIGELDLIVRRGDIITVPQAFVYVGGEVENPGAFPYNPSFSLEEYIGMAGGPTSRANLKKSFVIKRDGTRKSIKNAVIEKGDTIVIREVFLKWWQDYLTVVSAITTVIIAWLTISKR